MNLLERTAATGLYELREGGNVRNELEACQAALDLPGPRLERMENALFPGRMSREQLLAACRPYGVEPPAGLDIEALRQGVRVLREGPDGWTAAALEAWLARLGAAIVLREGDERMLIADGPPPYGFCADEAMVRALLEPLLPVGVVLSVNLDGMDWRSLDGLGLTAGELDAMDFTWTAFEREGPSIEN